MRDVMQTATDVLVIGSGAAGMYAAIEAARAGAQVFMIDRSLIGRGGATVMAQMTVAVALGALVAMLQYRAEQQAFAAATAIRRQKSAQSSPRCGDG